MIQVRQVGGAVNDVDAMATAYAHSTQNFCIGAVGYSLDALGERWDADVHPLMDGLYLSFDTDTRPERIHDAFPPATLARLRAVKAAYHPDDVFEQELSVQGAERRVAGAWSSFGTAIVRVAFGRDRKRGRSVAVADRRCGRNPRARGERGTT